MRRRPLSAVRRATPSIPIVFVAVLESRSAWDWSRAWRSPLSNLTGLLTYEESITGKWLAMLKEIAPGLSHAALVGNPPRRPTMITSCGRPTQLAPSLAIELVPSRVEECPPTSSVRSNPSRARPMAGLVFPPDDAPIIVHRDLCHCIGGTDTACPQIYPFRFFVAAGGLMSYEIISSTTSLSAGRQPMSTASCAAPNPPTCRCRRRPSTRRPFNLKTAKALGLTVPPPAFWSHAAR